MTDDKRNVKECEPEIGLEAGRWYVRAWAHCVNWFDLHPRLGWYLAALGVVNVVLNLLQIVLQLVG